MHVQYKALEKRKLCCTNGKYRDTVGFEKLMCHSIVGVKEPERLQKQKLLIDVYMRLDTSCCSLNDTIDDTISYATLSRAVAKYTEDSKHYLLETLCHGIARLVCLKYGAPEVTVRVEKPRAIPLASQAVVEITRTYDFFMEENAELNKRYTRNLLMDKVRNQNPAERSVVYLALGTNQGNTLQNLLTAITELKKLTESEHVLTSGLYSTPPAYMVNQPAFLNAAIVLTTTLDPFAFLRGIKDIEARMGRNLAAERNSPRVVDIDILFFGDTILESSNLCIPHKDLHKRLFVMCPLTDVAEQDYQHPVIRQPLWSIKDGLWRAAPQQRVTGEEDMSSLTRVVPLGRDLVGVGRKTLVLTRAATNDEVAAAAAAGATGVVVSGIAALLALCDSYAGAAPPAKVLFEPTTLEELSHTRLGELSTNLIAGFRVPPQLAKLASHESFAPLAELLHVSQGCVVVAAHIDDAQTTLACVEHVSAILQALGVHQWQIVADTNVAIPGAEPAEIDERLQLVARNGVLLASTLYPRCWDLSTLAPPQQMMFAHLAVQQSADVIVVSRDQVAPLLPVLQVADAHFRDVRC